MKKLLKLLNIYTFIIVIVIITSCIILEKTFAPVHEISCSSVYSDKPKDCDYE